MASNLPCPFCGKEPEVHDLVDGTVHLGCINRTCAGFIGAEASKWNRRTTTTRHVVEVTTPRFSPEEREALEKAHTALCKAPCDCDDDVGHTCDRCQSIVIVRRMLEEK